jgi:hypothetical protein
VHVQNDLLEMFPQYIGDPRTGKPRVIPFLPGKKLFGRSSTHYVADARLPLLNKYCQALCEATLPKDVREAGVPPRAHARVNQHAHALQRHCCSALRLTALRHQLHSRRRMRPSTQVVQTVFTSAFDVPLGIVPFQHVCLFACLFRSTMFATSSDAKFGRKCWYQNLQCEIEPVGLANFIQYEGESPFLCRTGGRTDGLPNLRSVPR